MLTRSRFHTSLRSHWLGSLNPVDRLLSRKRRHNRDWCLAGYTAKLIENQYQQEAREKLGSGKAPNQGKSRILSWWIVGS